MADGYKIKYGVQRDEVTCIPNDIWDVYLPYVGGTGVLVYLYIYRLTNQRSKIDFEYTATDLQLHFDDVQAAIAKLLEYELFTFGGANNDILKVNDPKSRGQLERYLQSLQRPDPEMRDVGIPRRLDEMDVAYGQDSVVSFGEREFGRPLTSAECRTLRSLAEDYPEELIKEAMSRAVLNGAPNLPYTQKILFNWGEQNVRTLEQVKVEDAKFQERKKRTTQSKKGRNTKKTVPKSNNAKSTGTPYYYSIYDTLEKSENKEEKPK